MTTTAAGPDRALDTAAGGCCSPLAGTPLSAEDATSLATQLKSLADPTRLRLISLIQAHVGGEKCVCAS